VPITNYRIYRGATSGSYTLLVEVGNVLTHVDDTVTNGNSYFYAVTAVTGVGEGPLSNEAGATPGPKPDTTRPTISILSPTEGATLASTSITVSGTAADDIGLSTVELSIDGTDWTVASGTTAWSSTLSLSQGPNRIYARATDTSGNSASDSVNITVNIEPEEGLGSGPTVLEVLTSPAGLVALTVGVIVGAVWLVVRRRGAKPPDAQ